MEMRYLNKFTRFKVVEQMREQILIYTKKKQKKKCKKEEINTQGKKI